MIVVGGHAWLHDWLIVRLTYGMSFYRQVGKIYAEIIEDASEPIIVKFFGIFFLLFQSAQIWGNLISSLGMLHLKNNPYDLFTER